MPKTPTWAVPGSALMDLDPSGDVSRPELLFNRELSWLDFNWRVLAQAWDERIPLLERVRFLSISASNLDEFFRKHVGGLKRLIASGDTRRSPDGRMPEERLGLIREAVLRLQADMVYTWDEVLQPALRQADIHVVDYNQLTDDERQEMHEHFLTNIYPILTPLAVDPAHPFPFISNLSLSLAVITRHPTHGTEHFARLKVPLQRGRFLRLSGEGYRFVPIEEVIVHNIGELFRGMEIVSVSAFRVTRNADLDRNESSAEDLLELIAKELRQRRFAAVVRLQVDTRMPGHVRQTLKHELGITDADVYEKRGLLELSDLDALANLGLPDHTYEHWEPVIPKGLVPAVDGDTANLFSIIRKGDVLVHHPYESFQASVARFIDEAAADPKVLAIKQTLYRTSNDSPIIYSLIRAAENGKQVAVLVELKARFDEERNIAWAKMLEQAGIHVTYGLVGLKTHTKTALVVREEPDGIAMYSHIGTGNYNSKTAKLYTDIGLLTCNREIGLDLVNLFHHLTGYAPEQQYRKLLVAPRDLRKTFLKQLEREIEHQQKHGNGHLIAVMNGLDDVVTIQALYEASQAGVQIDLVVRGHSRLRPGLPGVSDNIRLVSLIGRFLEHSRIYHFHNNGEPKTYIGSADWMRRNLEDRVEVITPIEDPALQRRVIRILKLALSDNRMGWDLHADGTYVQRQPGSESVRSFQEMLMKEALRTGRVPKAED